MVNTELFIPYKQKQGRRSSNSPASLLGQFVSLSPLRGCVRKDARLNSPTNFPRISTTWSVILDGRTSYQNAASHRANSHSFSETLQPDRDDLLSHDPYPASLRHLRGGIVDFIPACNGAKGARHSSRLPESAYDGVGLEE